MVFENEVPTVRIEAARSPECVGPEDLTGAAIVTLVWKKPRRPDQVGRGKQSASAIPMGSNVIGLRAHASIGFEQRGGVREIGRWIGSIRVERGYETRANPRQASSQRVNLA